MSGFYRLIGDWVAEHPIDSEHWVYTLLAYVLIFMVLILFPGGRMV